tara:strand:+ start:1010 stop:1942 length:933 start_codon:yes stop_codon:yes gene_type:complete
MKFELNYLNKFTLSVLLFICAYHLFSLLIQGSFLISLFFLCAAMITGRILINEQSKTKKSPYLHYFYALSTSWLALFLMFTVTNEQPSTLGIWFCSLILCTSILLKTNHALWLNTTALAFYWAFVLLVSNKATIFIESAFALTIFLLIASITQKSIHDLKNKLNIALKTDNLTGCIQPNTFRNELEKVIQLHNRYATPFSLICIKYQNDFSTENDLQIWLKELTHLYQSRLRKTDILCRFTTQKFMVLLPSTSSENAEALLFDLKNCTNAYEFSFKNSLTETIENPILHFSTEVFIRNENIENWFNKIQS